ncbi:MAG: lysylphosphatidylglycerol synthase transmembrane domain-containing protein, partial [Acidobacteriota bacterium]
MKRILQLTFVALLTIFFLGLFLWKSNLHQVGHILASTNWWWLLVGLAVNFGALLFRTARWRLIISRDDPPGFYATFFANTMGYMLSTVLPIRAGDVARPALLARRSNVRFATALGTVLTERVLDLFAILILFVTFCLMHWREYAASPDTAGPFLIVRSAAIAGASILIALFVFLVCLFFFGGAVRRLHEWLGRFLPQRFREPWMHFFDAFSQTLQITRDPAAFAMVLVFTGGVWFCLTAQFWFAALAANRPLPFDAGLFLGGATTVGIAIPTP